MTELQFSDVEVPTTTTTPKVNPFKVVVDQIVADWDANLGRSKRAITVSVPTADVKAHKRLITLAGSTVEKSMRQSVVDDAANGQSVITFWAVDKISRPRPVADPVVEAV